MLTRARAKLAIGNDAGYRIQWAFAYLSGEFVLFAAALATRRKRAVVCETERAA